MEIPEAVVRSIFMFPVTTLSAFPHPLSHSRVQLFVSFLSLRVWQTIPSIPNCLWLIDSIVFILTTDLPNISPFSLG